MQENIAISPWIQAALDEGGELDVICMRYSQAKEELAPLHEWLEKNSLRYIALIADAPIEDLDIILSGQWKCYGEDDQLKDLFTRIAWDAVFLRVGFFEKERTFHAELFEQCLLGVHLVASEMQDMAKMYVGNVRNNIERQQSTIDFYSLKDSLRSVPAIICGAGQSLDISALAPLSSKAVIFAAGASLAALSTGPACVHIAAGTDPDPNYCRFLESVHFNLPFFYQDRFSHQILSKIHGEKISVPANPGYFFDHWLSSSEAEDPLSFDGGWTVTTFMTAVAAHLGCSPIIFHGVDFAFSSKMYTDLIRENHDEENLSVIPLGSDHLKTKHDWIMASNWLKEFIASNQDIEFISTSTIDTFCGNKSQLSTLQDRLPSQDISSRVHAAFQMVKKIIPERKQQLLKTLSESLLVAQNILNQQLSLFQAAFPDDPTQDPNYVLLACELEQLPCYGAIIFPVWSVWKKVFDREEYPAPHLQTLNEILFLQKIVHAHIDQGDVYA